jgi:hypothetical protein
MMLEILPSTQNDLSSISKKLCFPAIFLIGMTFLIDILNIAIISDSPQVFIWAIQKNNYYIFGLPPQSLTSEIYESN